MCRAPTLAAVLITMLYPLAVGVGYDHLEPRLFAGLLFMAGLLRPPVFKIGAAARCWLAATLPLAMVAFWINHSLPLKLYPVLVNALMLGLFAHSLFVPPSMAERIARLRGEALGGPAIAYTRRVTQVWCGFFAVNGAIALITALWASAATWALYNGLIAYLLIGLLFAGEYGVRTRFKRRFDG